MGICKTCGEKIADSFSYCGKHNPNAKKNAKATQKAIEQAARNAQIEAALRAAEKERLKKIAADLAAKERAEAVIRQKQALIPAQAAAAKMAIRGLVQQVETLRAANPGRQNINAGQNADLQTITGGTNNPHAITAQSPVTKDEIINYLYESGFLENSDSGLFKHRTPDQIFIHVT
ncbi:hypothetical protein [Massilia sp. YIM B02443]|uniref:hypothetical protein n=1 Tax=Massilia sp. YIM B02443 TaxID=3050127 RepID=UPI0025B6D1C0|nr:hypothetical protein [Massilia sp. YIM B02443]MDN4037633.1 hypothetical protein [Massilia sp. YIM B02443]